MNNELHTWVITWWNGEKRQVRHVETEESARNIAQILRGQSDKLQGRSLVPIRVMPVSILEQMDALRSSTRQCRHGDFRLCISCLRTGIRKENS